MTTNTNATNKALLDEMEHAVLDMQLTNNFDRVRAAKNAILTALSTAAQPPAGMVMVPIELAERVQETMGEFLMDHGWRQQDMDTSDDFGALLAAAPKAAKAEPPTVDPLDALRWGANVAETLLSIGRAIGFGRAQQMLGEQWEVEHDCAPRGRMGVTVKDAPKAEPVQQPDLQARIAELEANLKRATSALQQPERVPQTDEAIDLLSELHALVWGECPSLLNEDSGGNSALDLRIRECIEPAHKEQP